MEDRVDLVCLRFIAASLRCSGFILGGGNTPNISKCILEASELDRNVQHSVGTTEIAE